MRTGFIFDHNKCVNCRSCSAACILYNDWAVEPRNILTYNHEADSLLPLINLSIACNHCETAACMKGCPSSAYSRDPHTGAVLLDRKKCIGCKYCQWNCPYDSPKYDSINRTIAKCNLCQTSLIAAGSPACSSACPTGALTYGQMSETVKSIPYPWFPDKNLAPAIEFTSGEPGLLKIIPEVETRVYGTKKRPKDISQEMSLVIFSFLSTLSVASLIMGLIHGTFPSKMIFVAALSFSGLVSLFHLGQKNRSWRAISNLKNSPLSREIAAFIVYLLLSAASVISKIPLLLVLASVAGLIFLIIIDSVYIYSDNRRPVVMHSGQTFISGLLIASFLSGLTIPFIFLGFIKLILSGKFFFKRDDGFFVIRFLRISFLILPAISFVSINSQLELLTIFIFLTGELLDRILFYADFNPLNINVMIQQHQNTNKNEKKGN